MKHLVLGTRGSKMAVRQAEMVKEALETKNKNLHIEIKTIKNIGDIRQGTLEASIPDKKKWVDQLELALINREIDFVVHCGKDVPAIMPVSTKLVSVLERGKPYDCFIGKGKKEKRFKYEDLTDGSLIGTASLRRQSYLKRINPNFITKDIRGNVDSRFSKLDNGNDFQGIILSAAGLDRMEYDYGYHIISDDLMIPAVNQGMLTVQYLNKNQILDNLFLSIQDEKTESAFQAERACIIKLEGNCHSAIGCYARFIDSKLILKAEVLNKQTYEGIFVEEVMKTASCQELGLSVALKLISLGARELLNCENN